MFVGLLLVMLAYWSFAVEGLGSSTLICAAAAALFLFRGAQGLTSHEAGDVGGDATVVIDFVSDPAGAIVDTATDRIGDWLKPDEPKPAAEGAPAFDPDAAIARYLEKSAVPTRRLQPTGLRQPGSLAARASERARCASL